MQSLRPGIDFALRPIGRAGALSLLATVAISTPAAAQTFNEPRAQGMGGAVHADPLGNSAMFGNPAGLARAYLYGFEANFFRTGPGDVNAMGLNIVDSKTQPSLAMGIAYAYEFSDPKTKPGVEGHDARMAFGHPLIPNQLALGVGLHYMHLNRTGGPPDLKAFTLDAGLSFSMTSALHLGIAGQNLIQTDDPAAPMLAGGGIAYTGSIATIAFDTMTDFTTQDAPKPVFQGGLEIFLGKVVPVRLGFERNQAQEVTRISGGLGFTTADEQSQGSQLNIAFTKAVEISEDYKFGAGFTLFL